MHRQPPKEPGRVRREWGDDPEQDRADAELSDIHGWWSAAVIVGMAVKAFDWWPGLVLGIIAFFSTLALTMVTYIWRKRDEL